MKKFDLSEFIFSDHAKSQQKERGMSYYEIERVLNFGTPVVNEDNGNTAYIFDHQTVVINIEEKIIVTVHPGDRPASPAKLTLIKSMISTEVAGPISKQVKKDYDGWVDITDAYMENRYYKKTG